MIFFVVFDLGKSYLTEGNLMFFVCLFCVRVCVSVLLHHAGKKMSEKRLISPKQ